MTVTEAWSEQPKASVTVTVYNVDALGLAVGLGIFELFNPVEGDHEYVSPLLPIPVGEPPITVGVTEHIEIFEPAFATTGLVIVKSKQAAGARFPHRSSTKPFPLTKHNEYVPEILKAGEIVALKLFSWVAPDAHAAPVTADIVYGPPGPVKVKSPSCTELHRMFSEKLKDKVVEPHVIGWLTAWINGSTLSKIVAVEALKLSVYPFVDPDQLPMFTTYVSPANTGMTALKAVPPAPWELDVEPPPPLGPVFPQSAE